MSYNDAMNPTSFVSWNINGYRAWIEKDGTKDFLGKNHFDVICFQETKAQPEQIRPSAKEHFPDHTYQYFFSAEKKGYSSVALLSRIEPISVSHGIDKLPLSVTEGRVITAEYAGFYLITVYTPNSKPDLARVDLRHQEWDPGFLEYIQALEKKKPVIICGDLNVAPTPLDLKNEKTNRTTDKRPGSPGATDKEREGFANYMKAGLIDTWRALHPEQTDRYTWWSYRSGARAGNAGWRIDFFLISESLSEQVIHADIHDEVTGSDHCPVSLRMQ